MNARENDTSHGISVGLKYTSKLIMPGGMTDYYLGMGTNVTFSCFSCKVVTKSPIHIYKRYVVLLFESFRNVTRHIIMLSH